MNTPQLLLIGPSTRAMAYSARRAGFEPICIDLFADTDLQAIATAEVIPLCDYPHGIIERLKKYPPNIPVLYTGGLENHLQVYLDLQQQRPVWGYVHPDPLQGESVRHPEYLDHLAKTKAILGRVSTPDDLVGATTFLASSRSDYITGQNLMVDGGVRLI